MIITNMKRTVNWEQYNIDPIILKDFNIAFWDGVAPINYNKYSIFQWKSVRRNWVLDSLIFLENKTVKLY